MAGGTRQVTAFRATETAAAEVTWLHVSGEQGDRYEVTASGPWGVVTADASDAFEALVRVRQQLEEQGWFLAVNGARRDTYPSGMAREQGGGLSVYEWRPGQPAGPLVRTFDDAPPASVGTVREQKENFEQCLSSFG